MVNYDKAHMLYHRTQLRSDELSRMNAEPDPELLARYVDAFERFDIDALVALFHEEGCMSMPPFAMWVLGKNDLSQFFSLTRPHCEGSRFLPVRALGDGRKVEIAFIDQGSDTKIVETFDAEGTNSVEAQQVGWQAILDNFKRYTEQA